MAEITTTQLYIAGRASAITVKGTPSQVQGALTGGGGAMVQLEEEGGGDVLIVNPAHVSYLEPGFDPDMMPLISVHP